jgi:hypothetical protein
MRVSSMGGGRIQTDPIINLISNSKGYVITSLERQAPYGATIRTRGESRERTYSTCTCSAFSLHYHQCSICPVTLVRA